MLTIVIEDKSFNQKNKPKVTLIEETVDLINTDLKVTELKVVKEPSFNSPKGSFNNLPFVPEKTTKIVS